jgi:hypothetical protein
LIVGDWQFESDSALDDRRAVILLWDGRSGFNPGDNEV